MLNSHYLWYNKKHLDFGFTSFLENIFIYYIGWIFTLWVWKTLKTGHFTFWVCPHFHSGVPFTWVPLTQVNECLICIVNAAVSLIPWNSLFNTSFCCLVLYPSNKAYCEDKSYLALALFLFYVHKIYSWVLSLDNLWESKLILSKTEAK